MAGRSEVSLFSSELSISRHERVCTGCADEFPRNLWRARESIPWRHQTDAPAVSQQREYKGTDGWNVSLKTCLLYKAGSLCGDKCAFILMCPRQTVLSTLAVVCVYVLATCYWKLAGDILSPVSLDQRLLWTPDTVEPYMHGAMFHVTSRALPKPNFFNLIQSTSRRYWYQQFSCINLSDSQLCACDEDSDMGGCMVFVDLMLFEV